MNRGYGIRVATAAAFVCLLLVSVGSAEAQWQIKSEKDDSSIKFGFMVQTWARGMENSDGDWATDIFFRRLRILAGGKINKHWSFFMETDSPNLGVGLPDDSKQAGDVYIQDLVFTFSTGDKFKVDTGLILIPTCYNCNTSAAKLLPVNYTIYGFLSSAAEESRGARDYGVQLRGYLFDKSLEYRAGVFQGDRGADGGNDMRYVGRVSYHFFEKQTGLFYTGTSLGKKQYLQVGASYDTQDDYKTYAFDVFWDQPLFEGHGLTLQADYINYDGGEFAPELPEQTATLFEAGWYFPGPRLGVFLQHNDRDFQDETMADTSMTQAGMAWYIQGYNLTLKLGYGPFRTDGEPDRDQLVVQLQTFMF